jgi:hypothetical protein
MVVFFRQDKKTHLLGKILEFILCLVPSFIFCFSYDLSRNSYLIFLVDFLNEIPSFKKRKYFMMDYYLLLLGPFYFLILDIIIYLILLIISEKVFNKEICYKLIFHS